MRGELLQGTLDMLILKALSWGPMHGYGVARWLQQLTDDPLQIEVGSLYPALHGMNRRGWIAAQWGVSENHRRARYYSLTAEGRTQLQEQTSSWTRFSGVVAKVLHAEVAS